MEKMEAIIGSVSILVASIAVLVAVIQTVVSRNESRRVLALTLYKGYLDLAMANPRFVFASVPGADPNFLQIVADPMERVRYDFYVSNLLFAAESILEVTKNDQEWRKTLRDQLSYHVDYLLDDEFDPDQYSQGIRALVSEVTALRGNLPPGG